MRAAVVTKPGGAEVLKVQEVPLAPLSAGFARVRIEHSALNAADLWTRRPGVVAEYPHIPGSDGCGQLVEVNGRSSIEIGSRVIINPALQVPPGRRSWTDPFVDIVDILGYNCPGTCAEYCDAPIENIFPAPNHLTSEEAAALPLTFLTAWRMLSRRGGLRRGEQVLIWGASGGLGSAAVTLAEYMGAHVLATAGNDKDAEAINKQTSAHVVRYDYGDIARQVREATGSQVDMIFDSVAGPAWKASLESLRPGGRIVLAGTSAGDVVTHDLSDFYYYQWSLLGCRMGDEQDFDAMRAAVSDGQLRPIVGRVFNLSQIAEAHQAMEDGRVFGKIVLKHTE